MGAALARERVGKVLACLDRFPAGQSVTVRECRLLVAVSPLVPLGPLHVRPVQQWFDGYGFRPWLHGHRHLLVTRRCLRTLVRWSSRSYLRGGVPLFRWCTGSLSARTHPFRDGVLSTGACRLVVAGSRPGRASTSLCWGSGRSSWPFRLSRLKGWRVPVGSDNLGALCYIYRQGGVRSLPLHRQARDLLVWAHVRLALLRAAYIPGS